MAFHCMWYLLKYSNYELYNSRAVELQSRVMDYRGSKSNKGSTLLVKEQRVDGSYCIKTKIMQLRCTLMGFKRNYQIKVLSKQLNI